jgi:hypothetical protein
MPFTPLTPQEREALATRLTKRGLATSLLNAAADLNVPAGHQIVLSSHRPSALTPSKFKPANMDQLLKWKAIPADVANQPAVKEMHAKEVNLIKGMVTRSRLDHLTLRPGQMLRDVIASNREQTAAMMALTRAAISGRFSLGDIHVWPPYIYEYINSYVPFVDGTDWTALNIVIGPNGALIFDPPGPHVLTVHSLEIMPGGKLVTDHASVTIDSAKLQVH